MTLITLIEFLPCGDEVEDDARQFVGCRSGGVSYVPRMTDMFWL
jgi:hypothetical protein